MVLSSIITSMIYYIISIIRRIRRVWHTIILFDVLQNKFHLLILLAYAFTLLFMNFLSIASSFLEVSSLLHPLNSLTHFFYYLTNHWSLVNTRVTTYRNNNSLAQCTKFIHIFFFISTTNDRYYISLWSMKITREFFEDESSSLWRY